MTPDSAPPQEPTAPRRPSDGPSSRAWVGTAAARGIALFLAMFSMLNLAIEFRQLGFDANIWWIDLQPLQRIPDWLGKLVLLWMSGLFIAYAVAPSMARWRRRTTRTTIELLGLIIAWNILSYYGLLLRGRIHTVFAVPFSIFVGFALAGVWLGARSKQPGCGPRAWLVIVGTIIACAVLFPLLQMVCFGLTDYRRPADVAVVFGARVYANGTPSDALADRVSTAVELYQKHLVSKLIFSGGPGDGAINEPDAMRKLAIDKGVDSQDILTDPKGLTTDATIRNTMLMLGKLTNDSGRPVSVLAVSHFYHLPRIKMRFGQDGREVYTVPVREPLVQTPKFMIREVAALWKYYFEALVK